MRYIEIKEILNAILKNSLYSIFVNLYLYKVTSCDRAESINTKYYFIRYNIKKQNIYVLIHKHNIYDYNLFNEHMKLINNQYLYLHTCV